MCVCVCVCVHIYLFICCQQQLITITSKFIPATSYIEMQVRFIHSTRVYVYDRVHLDSHFYEIMFCRKLLCVL